ncbi:MAG: RcpC/CpaB family pilus assembly protein [Dehalococcoidia bacterium]
MAAGSTRMRARSWALPHLDPRLLIGTLVVVVALIGGVTVINGFRVTEPVVVAARTLPPGHVIVRSDLTTSEARLEGALGALAVDEAEIATLVGRTTSQTIHAGALVVGPDLGSGPALGPGEMAVTVAVGADTVFAQLRRGDEVAVVETTEPGRPGSATALLLERATVYHVAADAGRLGIGGGAASEEGGRIANVTLIVPQGDAERVVHALVNGRLTLVLVPAP